MFRSSVLTPLLNQIQKLQRKGKRTGSQNFSSLAESGRSHLSGLKSIFLECQHLIRLAFDVSGLMIRRTGTYYVRTPELFGVMDYPRADRNRGAFRERPISDSQPALWRNSRQSHWYRTMDAQSFLDASLEIWQFRNIIVRYHNAMSIASCLLSLANLTLRMSPNRRVLRHMVQHTLNSTRDSIRASPHIGRRVRQDIALSQTVWVLLGSPQPVCHNIEAGIWVGSALVQRARSCVEEMAPGHELRGDGIQRKQLDGAEVGYEGMDGDEFLGGGYASAYILAGGGVAEWLAEKHFTEH